MATTSVLLRVVFFLDPQIPGVWNAQAIERDIAASGPDIESAKRAFERTVSAYIQLRPAYGNDPLAALKPAPDFFREAWDRLVEDRTPTMERLASIPAYMIPVVSHDPLQA